MQLFHTQLSDPAPASIRDVARRAKVSAATASRALRDHASVAESTRDRVLAAAHELGYSLPTTAERARQIGVLARYPNQWYFAEAITAIEETLAAADRRPVLLGIGEPEARRRFFERVLPRGQLDGIIIVSSSFSAEERTALDRLRVPITVIGGYAPGYDSVGIDDESAARIATQHLIGLGHRDIALISFDPEEPVGQTTTYARRRGFDRALDEAGLTVPPEWIVIADGSRMAGGVRSAERLLTLPKLPTAVFAMSDELAIGALQALRRAGLSVPGHISVVGFDDHEMAEYLDLTTIRQPVRDQARTATQLLLDGATGEAGTVELPVRLVVRGTTGPTS